MLETVKAWTKLDSLKKYDALAYLYELTDTEADAYFHLLNEGTVNVNELSASLGKDRTTAQRTLSKLMKENLAHRRKINLAKGGIKYCYEAVPFSNVKQNMVKRIDAWHSASRAKIYNL